MNSTANLQPDWLVRYLKQILEADELPACLKAIRDQRRDLQEFLGAELLGEPWFALGEAIPIDELTTEQLRDIAAHRSHPRK
jgi:hypothetical protein